MAGILQEGLHFASIPVTIFDNDARIDRLLDAQGWRGVGYICICCCVPMGVGDITQNGALPIVQRPQGRWAAVLAPKMLRKQCGAALRLDFGIKGCLRSGEF